MTAEVLCSHCGPMKIGSPHEVGCDVRRMEFAEKLERIRRDFNEGGRRG